MMVIKTAAAKTINGLMIFLCILPFKKYNPDITNLTKLFMKLLLAAAILIITGIPSFGQVASVPLKEWIKKLSDPEDKKSECYQLFYDSVICKLDTLRLNGFLNQLEANGNSHNIYFATRLKVCRIASLTYEDHLYSNKTSKVPALQLMKLAMQQANESNDEYLVAFVSKFYFSLAFLYNETELSVMHCIYSIELYEKLFGPSAYPFYQFAGELMYRVREYEKCKDYSLKWLAIMANTQIQENKDYRMSVYNTIALAYHRTGQYDTAMYYYNKALAETVTNTRPDWKGIISGNIGQVFYLLKQYDTALALLLKDYHISMGYKYFDNAANSLQWAARANAAMGNKGKALQQVREAITLIQRMPDDGYRQNIYYAAGEIFKINGLDDSAFYYSGLYQQLHDSLEKKISTSSLAISNMRLNEEKNRYNIRRMQQEKESQTQQRNFIILGIILLAIITVLFVNRQRLKLKYRQENLQKEKKIMETEMWAAKQQMEMFTQNIIEKTSLIEKLEEQMRTSNASYGQQETISTLSNLTILTEDDWGKFKTLFEKMYPLFFQRLKTKAPDITVAEQRMSALTRLQLTTRQMASMQGISPDSVHKTRQRLRQRLSVSNETNLDNYFCNL